MELIRSTDTKYEEYESLLLERDQIQKEAGQIWTAYIREFGQLLTDVYEEKLECIKRKKAIAYYQAAINHGGTVDPAAMQEYLDKEMILYYAELRQMIRQNEECGKSELSTSYEVQRSKTLYRRIAKLIHPDINPQTDRQDKLRALWERTQAAYRSNDVKALSETEVLVRQALRELGEGEIRVDVPDLDERIEELQAEIEEIMGSEPYTCKLYLDDEKAMQARKDELTEELETYKKYNQELDDIIEDLLQNGGITIKWLTS